MCKTYVNRLGEGIAPGSVAGIVEVAGKQHFIYNLRFWKEMNWSGDSIDAQTEGTTRSRGFEGEIWIEVAQRLTIEGEARIKSEAQIEGETRYWAEGEVWGGARLTPPQKFFENS